MAPSLAGAKLFSARVVDGFSVGLSRRGYAAAAQGVASNVLKGSAVGKRRRVVARKLHGFRILLLATTGRRIAPTRSTSPNFVQRS